MDGLGILDGFSGGEVWKLVAGRVPLDCVAASWCSCQGSPHDGIEWVPDLVPFIASPSWVARFETFYMLARGTADRTLDS
jgi:hypothetical protein